MNHEGVKLSHPVTESINGTAIQVPNQVQEQLELTSSDSTLQIDVSRDGQRQTFSVKPELKPNQSGR